MRQITDPVLRDFIDTYLPRVRQAFSPEHVILFGSRARGESTAESDIDLIVVARCFAREKFINRMGWFYREVLPRVPVDALCYTPEEFEKRRRDSWTVESACREGIWL
jgi:hypothetical protein